MKKALSKGAIVILGNLSIILFLVQTLPAKGQSSLFEETFLYFEDVLNGEKKITFKDAVFSTENTFLDGMLSNKYYCNGIEGLKILAEKIILEIDLNYDQPDKNKIATYAAIFSLMTDSISVVISADTFYHIPFTYDFDDIFGSKDWEQTFVSKLINTHKGNCHSLPYLYKIICEELNIPCHLALAPNHIYIKHRAEKGGWYNVELTSASFPTDAWLMASGYISLEAVQNGIYLDTLSEKESIALCVIDLAQGYNHKYPDNDGTFVIQCCNLALKHFPKYVNAILLKAETRLKQLQAMQKQYGYAYLKEVTKLPEGKKYWDEMNSLYMQLYQLGYRQMPEQMYVEWLASLITEKEKFTNKQVEQMNRD